MDYPAPHLGEKVYDVCVVGAGPAGLTVALECEAAGMSVLLVEAGEKHGAKSAFPSGDIEIIDERRHAALEVATRSGLGGTSHAWGGRCVPFDDIDFERRSFVPHSGWPISHEELKPFYSKAAFYLGCGNDEFASPAAGWQERSDVSVRQVERLSSQPRLGRRFKDRLKKSALLDVQFGYPVDDLALDAAGQSVVSIEFESSKQSRRPPLARSFVLACGGLQTTRILLKLQRRRPLLFAGEGGPLGRYYMGHLTGKIASIILHNPADVEQFEYTRDQNGYWCRRRFSFSKSTMLEQQLLNTVFWLGNPPFHDADHGSAAASCVFLTLNIPVLGKLTMSPDTYAFHYGSPPTRFKGHWANLVHHPIDGASGFFRAIGYRLARRDLRPMFLRNDRGEYALHYHSEQIPNPLSRVSLADCARDHAKLSVDFRFCDHDVQSIVKAHEVLDRALRESGKGYLKYWQPPEARSAEVLAQAQDGYHQIGSTRMGDDERAGTVDRNCRVHGLNNLYIASSSVFPTSSQANPTLATVAVAARIAAQLSKNSSRRLDIE